MYLNSIFHCPKIENWGLRIREEKLKKPPTSISVQIEFQSSIHHSWSPMPNLIRVSKERVFRDTLWFRKIPSSPRRKSSADEARTFPGKTALILLAVERAKRPKPMDEEKWGRECVCGARLMVRRSMNPSSLPLLSPHKPTLPPTLLLHLDRSHEPRRRRAPFGRGRTTSSTVRWTGRSCPSGHFYRVSQNLRPGMEFKQNDVKRERLLVLLNI